MASHAADYLAARRRAVFRPPAPRVQVRFHDAAVEAAFAVMSRHFGGNLARFLHGIGWTARQWDDWHCTIRMRRVSVLWEDLARSDTSDIKIRLAPYIGADGAAPPGAAVSFHDATIEAANLVQFVCFRGDRTEFLRTIRWSVHDWTDWHRAIQVGLESADAEDVARSYTRDMRASLEPFMSEAHRRLGQ